MAPFFEQTGSSFADMSLRCAGGISPAIVNSIYPMQALTAYHLSHHIPGLTGRWMDLRSLAWDKAFNGSFHRLSHGHHLFEDGFRVLINKDLKFGEFLHHLGMDSLTVRGIPNPLIPAFVPDSLAKSLAPLGISKEFIYEMSTINVPKILSGSLGLVCAGKDVLLVFSDAIPHTYAAAGLRFLTGSVELCLGLFPPNPLLLVASASEFAVGFVTLCRTIVDPVLPIIGQPASVFLPVLGQSVGVAALIGGCVGLFAGDDWTDVPKSILESAGAASVSTVVNFALSGSFLGPFLGPLAGVATFLVLKRMLDAAIVSKSGQPPLRYLEWCDDMAKNYFLESKASDFTGLTDYFGGSKVIPCLGCVDRTEPIGVLKGDKLLLSEHNLSDMEGRIAGLLPA